MSLKAVGLRPQPEERGPSNRLHAYGSFPKYWGYIGIMEKKMKTIIVGYKVVFGIYWGYIGIMEKKMETTGIIGLIKP